MGLKENKVRRTIKGDGNDGVYDIYYYREEDVKEAVLEFKETFQLEIYDLEVIESRFDRIFGKFEK